MPRGLASKKNCNFIKHSLRGVRSGGCGEGVGRRVRPTDRCAGVTASGTATTASATSIKLLLRPLPVPLLPVALPLGRLLHTASIGSEYVVAVVFTANGPVTPASGSGRSICLSASSENSSPNIAFTMSTGLHWSCSYSSATLALPGESKVTAVTGRLAGRRHWRLAVCQCDDGR